MKLEHLTKYNPTGSLYDRFYDSLFDYYENNNLLRSKETPIIEGSVGNAGAAFFYSAQKRGYKNYTVIIPEDAHPSRIDILLQMGARIISRYQDISLQGGKILFSPKNMGQEGYIRTIENIVRLDGNRRSRYGRDIKRILPMTKVRKHRITNPPYEKLINEIIGDLRKANMNPAIDRFVFGFGSGNTITESAIALKKKFENKVEITCCEFEEHPYIYNLKRDIEIDKCPGWMNGAKGAAGKGVSPNKLNMELDVIDSEILINANQREHGLYIANQELNLYAGNLSGLMIGAAFEIAKSVKNKNILTYVFDSQSKYTEKYEPIYDLDFYSGEAVAGKKLMLMKAA